MIDFLFRHYVGFALLAVSLIALALRCARKTKRRSDAKIVPKIGEALYIHRRQERTSERANAPTQKTVKNVS